MTRKKRSKLRLPFSLSPKKIKGWKKHQEKIRFKRLGKKLFVVCGLWLVVAFLFLGYKSWKFLTKPLAQEQGSGLSPPRWNGKTQLNLLLFNINNQDDSDYHTISYSSMADVAVVTFNPAEGTLRFFVIPLEILVETEKGTYPAKKLFALGATLNPPAETGFLIDSMQGFLAVPLDGYISLRSNSRLPPSLKLRRAGKTQNSKLEGEVVDFHQQLKSPKIIFQIPQILQFAKADLKTNLSAGQSFRLLWQVRKVRFDKLSVTALPEHILSSERINTDEDVLVVNEKLLDEVITEIFAEPGIITERIKVSVKNGTKTPGLATKAARFLKNLGTGVIEIGNAETQDCEKTQILDYTGVPTSRTLQRLEDVFGVESERIEVFEARRADVEIVVGEDFQ
ncbi:MAG: LytR C-terminal domain-containing protein [Candidatus Cloacimonetes bacterium]|nr:LytR C-terminal domain-containing protein [Candidatus Cloacimonadota bacterium]